MSFLHTTVFSIEDHVVHHVQLFFMISHRFSISFMIFIMFASFDHVSPCIFRPLSIIFQNVLHPFGFRLFHLLVITFHCV